MEEVLKFVGSYKYGAREMIGFATWWQQQGYHFGPGPTSPDLKDWIEIEMLNDDFFDEWTSKQQP